MNSYAAYSKDNNLRLKSSSGAIFSEFANFFLKHGGIVYGVAMSDNCYYAEFIRVDSEEKLDKLRGSKYLQARMGDTYMSVQKDLENGKKVLFSGTSCQINGLKKFLNEVQKNLICIDVICHGTPSQTLWKKYVEHYEEQHGKLKRVSFRSKDVGWSDYGMKLNNVYNSKNVDSYMQMFLRDYALRPSCYNCTAKKNKFSDITIGDFWGIDEVASEMNDEQGVSVVIIRTEAGKRLLSEIKDRVVMEEVRYDEAVRYNCMDYSSVSKPKQRDSFFDDMNNMTFEALSVKYASPEKISFVRKWFIIVKKLIRKCCINSN